MLAACRFDLDDVDRPPGPGSAPTCVSYGEFDTPRSLPFNTSSPETMAALSPDGQSLVFNVNDSLLISHYDMVMTDFGGASVITSVTQADNAGWSADGMRLYFSSDSSELRQLSVIGPGPQFGAPQDPEDVDDLPPEPVRLRFTADNLEAFFWDRDLLEIHHYTRGTIADPWTRRSPTTIELAVRNDQRSPTITGDGLTLFFAADDFLIYSSTRPDRERGFALPTVHDFGADSVLEPEISRDGTILIFTRVESGDDQLYLTTRECFTE